YLPGRAASGDRAEKLIEERPRWATIRDALVGNREKRNFLKTLLIVTLLRLPPNSPFAMTNLLLSSVRVPLPIYVVGTALGMAPRTLLVAYVASKIQTAVFDPEAVGPPPWMILVGAVMFFGVLFILNQIAKKALAAATRPDSKPAA
ncbi:MAG: VTT domain-containing protein, partial [Phycisphaerales bacterium]